MTTCSYQNVRTTIAGSFTEGERIELAVELYRALPHESRLKAIEKMGIESLGAPADEKAAMLAGYRGSFDTSGDEPESEKN